MSQSSLLAHLFAPAWIFPLVTTIGVVLALYATRRPLGQCRAFATGSWILAAPISRNHYDLLFLPAVFLLWSQEDDFAVGKWMAVAWLLTEVSLRFIEDVSLSSSCALNFVARLAVTIAIAVAPAHLWDRTQKMYVESRP